MQEIPNLSKEVQRILSRAERLRIATSQSTAILSWTAEDIDHMAEAASMLWDQAQALFNKDASLKPELNSAISKIFEPLLMFSGNFKLSARLAQTRIDLQPANAQERRQASSFKLLMLALQFRFVDNFEWERQATYDEALASIEFIYGEKTLPTLDELLASISMDYLGLENLARKRLVQFAAPLQASNLNISMPTPKFWRDTYASPLWKSWSESRDGHQEI